MIARLLAVALLVSSCGAANSTSTSKKSPVSRNPCKTDRDCNQKNVCLQCDKPSGRCARIANCCSWKTDCRKGKCMFPSRHVFGFCDMKAPKAQICPKGHSCPRYPKCTLDAHCRHKSEFCLAGTCRICATDAHCLSLGFLCATCNRRKGTCDLRPDCCERRVDCRGKNMLCQKLPGKRTGRCVPGCLSDAVCPPDHYCDGGVCRKKNTAPR